MIRLSDGRTRFFRTAAAAAVLACFASQVPAEKPADDGPPLQVMIDQDKVVREGQMGPLTKGRATTIDMAHDMADRMLKAMSPEQRKKLEALTEGVKTQADYWAEEQERIVRERRINGPERTKNFWIPGTTPELGDRLQQEDVGIVMKDGYPTYVDGNMNELFVQKPVNDELISAERMNERPADIPPEKEPVAIEVRLGEAQAAQAQEAAMLPEPVAPDAAMPQSALDGERSDPSLGFDPEAMKAILEADEKDVSRPFADRDSGRTDCPACAKPLSNLDMREVFRRIGRKIGRMIGHAVPAAQAKDAPAGKPWTEDDIKAIRDGYQEVVEKNRKEGHLVEKGEFRTEAADDMIEKAAELVYAAKENKAVKEGYAALGLEEAIEEAKAKKAEQVDPTETYIFVSYSLGDEALRDILKAASGKETVRIVMRGVPEGMNLGEGILRMQGLAAEFDPVPNIVLDPTLFRAYGVKHVPTVVRVDPHERMLRPLGQVLGEDKPDNRKMLPDDPGARTLGKMIAKVEGLNNDRWLTEQIEAGRTGDFGNKGYIYPIDERDIILVMQERMMKVDWDAKRKAAAANFWKGQDKFMTRLKSATVSQVRKVDPSIVVTEDFRDHLGNVIWPKNSVINPLTQRPFHSAIIVFNPLREEEIRVAEKEAAEALKHPDIRRVMYLVTEMKTEKGWDFYTKLTDRLDAPVYWLMPEVRDRWQIEVTPSVITADMNRNVFLVKEINPYQGEPEAVSQTPAKEGE